VHAPESGVLVASQRFLGPKAVALLMQTDTGAVILFGEVFPKSWEAYGLRIGSRVEAGDPVAEVGITPGGSSMLHYEMYTRGTRQNAKWMTDREPPRNLLDPTQYLKTAVALDSQQDDDQIDDTTPDDDPIPDDQGDDDDDLPSDCPDGWHWDPLMQTCVADLVPPVVRPPVLPPVTPPGPGTVTPPGPGTVTPPVPGPGGEDPVWPPGGDDDVPDIGPPPMLPDGMTTGAAVIALAIAALLVSEWDT
jgi:hypothetical protein